MTGKPLIETLFPTCETNMPRKKSEPTPRPVGRPKSRPDGASFWGVWVTPEEKTALKAHLAKLRKRRRV
jgi:hypothetical protein